jgi:DNA-nicking Smr family endonuclease
MAIIEDIDLWLEYSKSVKKLDKSRLQIGANSINTLRIKKVKVIGDGSSYLSITNSLQPQTKSAGNFHSFQVDKLNKIERRNFKGEASIDLHGYRREEFPVIIESFCLKCVIHKIKNVIIITGKGEGILKKAVDDWLISNPNLIIGFFEIRDSSGGSGAFGVRLRTRSIL